MRTKLTAQQETVWLDGVPIGVVKNGALYNVLPGHLGEPLLITNASGKLVWSWDHDPFGNGAEPKTRQRRRVHLQPAPPRPAIRRRIRPLLQP
jgi:uncharacterized protein RhaS with RHS repeats